MSYNFRLADLLAKIIIITPLHLRDNIGVKSIISLRTKEEVLYFIGLCCQQS